MKLSQDTLQRIKMSFLFIYTGIRTMLATLLTIFVYQLCQNADGIVKDCSLKDNFTNLSTMNLIAIILNFLTLGIFSGFYLLEYYREHKCIKYLDVDESLPTNNLKNEIMSFPKIELKLIRLNIHYRNYSFIMFIVNIINIIVSSLVIYKYYGGYKSIVGMISEVFLIVDKLYTSINIAYKSVKELLPYSAYMKDYIIFNTIDAKYKQKKVLLFEKAFDIELKNDVEKHSDFENML
jgi:hypothetical protein